MCDIILFFSHWIGKRYHANDRIAQSINRTELRPGQLKNILENPQEQLFMDKKKNDIKLDKIFNDKNEKKIL